MVSVYFKNIDQINVTNRTKRANKPLIINHGRSPITHDEFSEKVNFRILSGDRREKLKI